MRCLVQLKPSFSDKGYQIVSLEDTSFSSGWRCIDLLIYYAASGLIFLATLKVKDIVAYLQLVDNPSFSPAFVRVVNTPKRGIGAKVGIKPCFCDIIDSVIARW
jgi:hypothetical protein